MGCAVGAEEGTGTAGPAMAHTLPSTLPTTMVPSAARALLDVWLPVTKLAGGGDKGGDMGGCG